MTQASLDFNKRWKENEDQQKEILKKNEEIYTQVQAQNTQVLKNLDELEAFKDSIKEDREELRKEREGIFEELKEEKLQLENLKKDTMEVVQEYTEIGIITLNQLKEQNAEAIILKESLIKYVALIKDQ